MDVTGTGLEYTNHSCDPNCRVVVSCGEEEDGRHSGTFTLIALREIKDGEAPSFDYDSNEYDMANCFECACGAGKCRTKIQGYKYLDGKGRREIEPIVSIFLVEMTSEEKS